MEGKKRIQFITHNATFLGVGTTAVFLFYPNGLWDEEKRTLEEALAAFPPEEWEWVNLEVA